MVLSAESSLLSHQSLYYSQVKDNRSFGYILPLELQGLKNFSFVLYLMPLLLLALLKELVFDVFLRLMSPLNKASSIGLRWRLLNKPAFGNRDHRIRVLLFTVSHDPRVLSFLNSSD